MTSNTPPEIGQPAPDITVRGPRGVRVTLSEHRGSNHVLLVFFPFTFSPTCSHQLPAISAELPRLQELGVQVIGISVDSHWANEAFAEKLGLAFPLLSDANREATRTYGVLLGGLFSNRALFLVDRDGRLAYKAVSDDLDDIPDLEKVFEALKSPA